MTNPEVFLLELTSTESMVVASGRAGISKTFDELAPLSDLIQWASDRPAFTQKHSDPMQPAYAVYFNEATGKINLRVRGGSEIVYDPHSEEDLAKFVRRLKALAFRPTNTQQPFLPIPDIKQYTGEVSTFTNPAFAKNYQGQARYRQPARKGPVASLADINNALDNFFNSL